MIPQSPDERPLSWHLTWVAHPSFCPSYGVRIDGSKGRIWVVPDRGLTEIHGPLHTPGNSLFQNVPSEPLPSDLRASLLTQILRLRIGLAPQADLGCDGTTHALNLRVGSHRLELGWWNHPEGALVELRPLIELLESLAQPHSRA